MRRAPSLRGGAGTQTADVSIPIQGGELKGYLARPRATPRAAPYWPSTRTAASSTTPRTAPAAWQPTGYVALAPDLLSREGGTGAFQESDATAALGKANADTEHQDLLAALDWLGQAVRHRR